MAGSGGRAAFVSGLPSGACPAQLSQYYPNISLILHYPNISLILHNFLKRHSGEKSGRYVVIEECIQDKWGGFKGLMMVNEVEKTI